MALSEDFYPSQLPSSLNPSLLHLQMRPVQLGRNGRCLYRWMSSSVARFGTLIQLLCEMQWNHMLLISL